MVYEMPIKPPCEEVRLVFSNEVTLDSYNKRVQEYILGTPAVVSGSFKEWIDVILSCLSRDSKILEVGSGFGRDADYIESFGFKVERTDATESFVTFLREQGRFARRFNILTDPFEDQYDLIFANAVFLHFTPVELEIVLQKIHSSLKNNGILAFSVKKGEGEEWTSEKLGEPRYFCYWDRDRMIFLLKKVGLEIVHIHEDERYLQVIVKPDKFKESNGSI